MGRLSERIGGKVPLTVGPMVVAVGMLTGLLIEVDGSYWTTVFPAVTIMAAGMALAVAPLTSTVLGSVDQRHTGTASGLNSAVARTGGLIATAMLGAVLAREGAELIGGFHSALIAAAAVSVLAGLCALFSVPGKQKAARGEPRTAFPLSSR
jgi:predicted MFS family arabinose efflux permease